jgi:hypothetical protein
VTECGQCERGFAGSRCANQSQHFTSLDRDGNAVDNGTPAGYRLDNQVLDVEDRIGHQAPFF